MIPSTPIPVLTTAYLSALSSSQAYSSYQPYTSITGGGGGGGSASYWGITTSNTNNTYPSFKSSYEEVNIRLDAIEKRLCILRPNVAKHKRFAALESAYNNYLLLEKLCYEQEP